MKKRKGYLGIAVLLIVTLYSGIIAQQDSAFEVIAEKETLKTIIPASFYFAGLSGNVQQRNSAAAKIGEKRMILAGLIDVSGYSTEISGIYEGFFITDSPVKFGEKNLAIGAYGIGFSTSGSCNLFDLSGKQILTVNTTKDEKLRRPRPLMMAEDKAGIRLYKGRDYVVIQPE